MMVSVTDHAASAVQETPMVGSEVPQPSSPSLRQPSSPSAHPSASLVAAVDGQVTNYSVQDALAHGSVFGLCPLAILAPAFEFAMGDWFSLSVLQILSVLSFATSLLAVVRVGSASIGRLQHKFEAHVPQQPVANVATSAKIPMWSWKVSGLPVSFSLGSILGEDEREEGQDSMGDYEGGSKLVRMDWQVARPAIGGCSLPSVEARALV
jgi:hypothetical protein